MNKKYLDIHGVNMLWNKIKSTFYQKIESEELLNNKVDKIEGKSLSTNDYTNNEKTKVNLIESDGLGNEFLSDDGSYKFRKWSYEKT